MKRLFINQIGNSNKFWRIEIEDKTQEVTWGKIGTVGRIKNRIFVSAEECKSESDKLIREKISRGYHEISESEYIPEKLILNNTSMNEDIFWEIISSFNWNKLGDDFEVMKSAIKKLVGMNVEDIYKFDDILSEKLYLIDGISYASNIGEYSYKGQNEPFSVDLFLYVRCCVVAMGREYYDYIVTNPEDMPKNSDYEPLLHLPSIAYNKKTDTEDYEHCTKFDYETFSNINGWILQDHT